jgi:hydrogenase expression/formation protein HypE
MNKKDNTNKLLKKDKKILLSHGDGGLKTSELINDLIIKYLGNDILNKLEDSSVINIEGKKIAYTTDSFTVKPLFFRGGDIGKLSVCGTINDLVCSGAIPIALSLGLIIEEGFEIESLEKIIKSISKTSKNVNVPIITGDTKVVEKNSIDKLFINTSGIGIVDDNIEITPRKIKPKDKVIINGTIAEHGIAVLTSRDEFNFKTNIKSDCAPLLSLVNNILSVSKNIHAIRDATRGGIASVLNEFADIAKIKIEINEENIPIRKQTLAVCEFLGLDPLYIANEGKILIFVSPEDSEKVLESMKSHKYGKKSEIIGEVKEHSERGIVILNTKIGTKRIIDSFYSEQFPRIC